MMILLPRLERFQPTPCNTHVHTPTPRTQIAVHFLGSVAEALLQLPEVPFSRADAAAAAGVPSGLWVTVGLLAADGFALQLRLRKADKVRVYAYMLCNCVLVF